MQTNYTTAIESQVQLSISRCYICCLRKMVHSLVLVSSMAE